jgi:hypothetical protein
MKTLTLPPGFCTANATAAAQRRIWLRVARADRLHRAYQVAAVIWVGAVFGLAYALGF